MDINTTVTKTKVLRTVDGMYLTIGKSSGHLGYKYSVTETYELKKATPVWGSYPKWSMDMKECDAINAFPNLEEVPVTLTKTVSIDKV